MARGVLLPGGYVLIVGENPVNKNIENNSQPTPDDTSDDDFDLDALTRQMQKNIDEIIARGERERQLKRTRQRERMREVALKRG